MLYVEDHLISRQYTACVCSIRVEGKFLPGEIHNESLNQKMCSPPKSSGLPCMQAPCLKAHLLHGAGRSVTRAWPNWTFSLPMFTCKLADHILLRISSSCAFGEIGSIFCAPINNFVLRSAQNSSPRKTPPSKNCIALFTWYLGHILTFAMSQNIKL